MILLQEDYDTVDFVMEEINKYQYPEELQSLVDVISGQILNLESANAIETLEKIKRIL